MRPEKAWRPIVTVEIDKRTPHETTLGVDGQNPNLKQAFQLWVPLRVLQFSVAYQRARYDVKLSSTVELKVWHRSQSKKKGKKRNLVAVATHTLGDLMKKLEGDLTGKSRGEPDLADVFVACVANGSPHVAHLLDIRLACQNASKKTSTTSNAKCRPQNGAFLTIKLAPPASGSSAVRQPVRQDSLTSEPALSTEAPQSGYTSEAPSSSSSCMSPSRTCSG